MSMVEMVLNTCKIFINHNDLIESETELQPYHPLLKKNTAKHLFCEMSQARHRM